jgi:DNA-binding transcriptional ArsR family regulator
VDLWQFQSAMCSRTNACHVDRTFRALADATRRGTAERLARGETSLGELAEPLG